MRVLLADDDATLEETLGGFLRRGGHRVEFAPTGDKALAALGKETFDVLLTDLRMPGVSGLDLLVALRERSASTIGIVFTGYGDEDLAIDAFRAGALDYLRKPIDLAALERALLRAEELLTVPAERASLVEGDKPAPPPATSVRRRSTPIPVSRELEEVGIYSPVLRAVFERARRFRPLRDVPVLIEGESGTGKELVARYLHEGAGEPGPFVAINCAAVPPEIFQSEMFGYEGGAFTGARATGSAGKLDVARGGTIFLDEIAEVSVACQAHLLRVLETRDFFPVGGLRARSTDARFVFATNRSVAVEVAAGRFRTDLYHRIRVGHVVIPPLRQRPDEIVPLARRFLLAAAAKHGRRFDRLSGEVEADLASRPWSGNVRELKNTIERAVILGDGVELLPGHLAEADPPAAAPPARSPSSSLADFPLPKGGLDLEEHELSIVERALELHGGNRPRTAHYLGLTPKALQSRLRRLARRPKP